MLAAVVTMVEKFVQDIKIDAPADVPVTIKTVNFHERDYFGHGSNEEPYIFAVYSGWVKGMPICELNTRREA